MKVVVDIAPHEDGVHCDATCHLAMIIPIQNNHVLIRIQCPFLPPRYATASDMSKVERPDACIWAQYAYERLDHENRD